MKRKSQWINGELHHDTRPEPTLTQQQGGEQEAGDAGPWHVGKDARDVFSADFTADVALRISGDFRDDEHKRQYAEWLVNALNAAALRSKQPAPREGFVDCVFVGPPPEGFEAWNLWADEPIHRNVTIKATETSKNGECVVVDCRIVADEPRGVFMTDTSKQAAGEAVVTTFAEWLASEMPAGTVIGDPRWWANRIARQYQVRCTPRHPAEKDAARLDYIERTFSGMTNRERYLPVQMIWGKGCNGRTLREACDKYMAKESALAGSP